MTNKDYKIAEILNRIVGSFLALIALFFASRFIGLEWAIDFLELFGISNLRGPLYFVLFVLLPYLGAQTCFNNASKFKRK